MNRLEIINLCLSGQDCAEQAGQIRQSVTAHELGFCHDLPPNGARNGRGGSRLP